MPRMTCEICGKSDIKGPQGMGPHMTAHRRNGHKSQEVAVARVRQKPGRKSVLDLFQAEQNVETAIAYVLAAKFPRGIVLDDYPRVVRIVKAVDRA